MGSEQHRFLQHQEQRKRWGGCLRVFSCFKSQKGGKRIVPASRIPEGGNVSASSQPNQPGGVLSNNQTTGGGVHLSYLAPPSSPASFSNSALPSTAQSPNNSYLSLAANSSPVLGPSSSMYATGPYAHETQLVSPPPVFSTFTTEPSTAPFTPPPELACHLTTPSSPDVPYARFLTSSSVDLKKGGGHYNDLHSTYSLYPGSPASALRSPVSRASGDGVSTPLQESNFFCPETFAKFYQDHDPSVPQNGGRLSVSKDSDVYPSNGYGNGNRHKDSLIRCTNSPALVSLTKTPNPTAIANKSAGINNGFISKTLKPGGTSTSPLPVGNLVPVSAISNATLSTPVTCSLVAEAPSVTGNGDSSSSASGTADHSMRKTELTTPVQALTVTSSSDSQSEVSQSETAKATEDAAIGQSLNADGLQAPMENVSSCENPSESLNDKTTPENGQESSKDATEEVASETCQNHSTETPTAVESDHGLKMTAEPSMPKENPAYQTEETASQPPSQTEKETPNAQDTVQNAPGDSQEGKGLNGLDDARHHEQPSDP